MNLVQSCGETEQGWPLVGSHPKPRGAATGGGYRKIQPEKVVVVRKELYAVCGDIARVTQVSAGSAEPLVHQAKKYRDGGG